MTQLTDTEKAITKAIISSTMILWGCAMFVWGCGMTLLVLSLLWDLSVGDIMPGRTPVQHVGIILGFIPWCYILLKGFYQRYQLHEEFK